MVYIGVMRLRHTPASYGPAKTIDNRIIRWSRMGVFNRIFAALAAKGSKPDQLMIDALPRAKALLADRGYDAISIAATVIIWLNHRSPEPVSLPWASISVMSSSL